MRRVAGLITPSLEDRFEGCLLGLAVGDALGARFEGLPGHYFEQRYDSPAELVTQAGKNTLRYTDDTQMAIGVTEALCECGRIEEKALCRRFAANFEPHRGYGRSAWLVLQAMVAKEDHNYLATNLLPGGSFGNGGAMRVAPVGLFFRDDPDEIWHQPELSALPTHKHPLGIEGAQVMALAIGLASSMETLDRAYFFETLAQRCTSALYSGPLRRAANLNNVRDLGLFGNGIEATSSVVTAIAAFGLTPNAYSETIGNAIMLGGDTDTIAAMAGALSGAYLGRSALPEQLLENLEDELQGRRFIESLAQNLYLAFSRKGEAR